MCKVKVLCCGWLEDLKQVSILDCLASWIFLSYSFVDTQNFLQTCPTPTYPFNIKVIYFWYFRTHLASTCKKQIEINHRCSQTEFKAMVAWCSDAACGARGRGLLVPHSLCEVNMPTMSDAKQMLNIIFSFHLFSQKWKSSLGFFQLTKIDINIGLL